MGRKPIAIEATACYTCDTKASSLNRDGKKLVSWGGPLVLGRFQHGNLGEVTQPGCLCPRCKTKNIKHLASLMQLAASSRALRGPVRVPHGANALSWSRGAWVQGAPLDLATWQGTMSYCKAQSPAAHLEVNQELQALGSLPSPGRLAAPRATRKRGREASEAADQAVPRDQAVPAAIAVAFQLDDPSQPSARSAAPSAMSPTPGSTTAEQSLSTDDCENEFSCIVNGVGFKSTLQNVLGYLRSADVVSYIRRTQRQQHLSVPRSSHSHYSYQDAMTLQDSEWRRSAQRPRLEGAWDRKVDRRMRNQLGMGRAASIRSQHKVNK